MAGTIRCILRAIGMICAAGALAENAAFSQDRGAWLRTMQEDAALADVHFVDAKHGWAVGDRGVVWATSNGGQNWNLQPIASQGRLNCVHFLDARHGCAAGGELHPYLEGGRGLLLQTSDGGESWQSEPNSILPSLAGVRFLTPSHGFAFGESSSLFPTGVMATTDRGRTWSPVLGDFIGRWTCGDFGAGSGSVAGPNGTIGAVRQRGLRSAAAPAAGLRQLRQIELAPSPTAWAVGDGGLVLRSTDAGISWQSPEQLPAAPRGESFDWRAVATFGTDVWIAGSPGTCVMHSADGGRSWHAGETGQSLPLAGLSFADERHGWAVGELGTILATADGGRTWTTQRAGGKRAAMLCIFSGAESVPWELLGRLSANDGYLSQVLLVGRRDQEVSTSFKASLPDRVRAAVAAAGGSGAETLWQFPLRQSGLSQSAGQMTAAWDRAHAGRGLEVLEAALACRIRTWRPEIVLTHAVGAQTNDPADRLVHRAVLRAAEAAASAEAFPEQLQGLGLSPWRVRKVFGVLPEGQSGTLKVSTSQLAARLGVSLADLAAPARGLVRRQYLPAPTSWGFRGYANQTAEETDSQDFFSGISLIAGEDARRKLIDAPAEGVDLLRQAASKHRNLTAILARRDLDDAAAQSLLGQVGELTGGLNDRAAGELLFQLGQRYYCQGRWELAAETFQVLANQYPQHPLAPSVLVWLIQYWSSGEAAWRAGRQERAVAQAGQARPAVGGVPAIAASARSASIAAAEKIDRPAQALICAEQLQRIHAAQQTAPEVQFPLAAALRQMADPSRAGRFSLDLFQMRGPDAWRACAAGETWLTTGRGERSKDSLRLSPAMEKPRLDGRLTEEFWKRAPSLPLASALGEDGSWPAVAMLACDREFLYLAVQCRKAAGIDYTPGDQPRRQDADLSQSDRVELYLDLDRDWTTYYRLTVDHRGFAHDECWHDESWNPAWYIAADSDADQWTVEAAIPFAELAPRTPDSRSVWGLGAQRIVPGAGFQSWTTPAAVECIPEGFGYLMFDVGTFLRNVP